MAFNANKYRSDYQKNKYDRVVLYLPKGEKQKWQEAATKAGMSLNAFIVDSASANIENGFCPEKTAPNIPSVPTSSAFDDKEALYAERNRQMDELAAQFSADNYRIPEDVDEAEDDLPFELGIQDTMSHISKKESPTMAYLRTVLAANQKRDDEDDKLDPLPWEE